MCKMRAMNTSATDILGADRLARLELPIAEARGLPSEAYTSQALFDLERERLFRRTWMGAAFAHEIPQPGDALPLTIAGVEVIVLRDREGDVRAFHNVCRHRASTVLQEPAKGLAHLRCPYHCWTYDLDGRLKATPLWDGTPKGKNYTLDPAENALVPIRCGVWHDIVFVNLTGDATPLEDYVAPLSKLWAGYDLDSPRPFEHAESTMDANWKVVKEGLLDVYHEEFVHPALSYRIDRDGTKTWEDIMVGRHHGDALRRPRRRRRPPGPVVAETSRNASGRPHADIYFPAVSVGLDQRSRQSRGADDLVRPFARGNPLAIDLVFYRRGGRIGAPPGGVPGDRRFLEGGPRGRPGRRDTRAKRPPVARSGPAGGTLLALLG